MNFFASETAEVRSITSKLWWKLATKGTSGAVRKVNRRRKRNALKRQQLH
jgi:hypothetical protein